MSKTGIIIQCHYNSTRLRGKILKKINDKTILEHVINECMLVEGIDYVIVATTTDSTNIPIYNEVDYLKNYYSNQYDYRLELYKSNCEDNNVLGRYWNAAKEFKLDTIIRITSDCYNHNAKIIETCLKAYKVIPCSVLDFLSIDGMDTQVVSFESLDVANKEAKTDYQREHVFPFLYENKERFKILHLEELKMSVDEEKDYIFAKKLMEWK